MCNSIMTEVYSSDAEQQRKGAFELSKETHCSGLQSAASRSLERGSELVERRVGE